MELEKGCYYNYEVIFYDEIEKFDAPYRKVKGVIYGESFKEAMSNLMNYYGEDNIVDLHITEGDHECYEFSDVGVKYSYTTNSYIEVDSK